MSTNWSAIRQHPAVNGSMLVLAILCVGLFYSGMTGGLNWGQAEQGPSSVSPRSVAYYTANIREAKEVNRSCYQVNPADAPAKEECENALKALVLSHVGQNYQN